MLKNDVEEIVGKYCDGTWTNLDNAYFVDSAKPQKLADELVEYIESLLIKRAPDAAPRPPFFGQVTGAARVHANRWAYIMKPCKPVIRIKNPLIEFDVKRVLLRRAALMYRSMK